jgi:hypothetical protein
MLLALLLIFVALLTYLLFSKGFWLDKWARSGELETDEDDLYRNPSSDFQVHIDEYNRKNNETESWMTRHDREYEQWQKEEDKWQL